MCSLMRMCSFVLPTFLLAGIASAESSYTIVSEFDSSVVREPLALTSQSTGEQSRTYSASLGFKLNGLEQYYTAQTLLKTTRPDYSTTVLHNSSMVPQSMSNPNDLEYNIDFQLGWSKGPRGISFGYISGINESPYKLDFGSLRYFESFYEKSTILEIELRMLSQKSPDDFFVDRDFKVKERPQRIHASEAILGWEQIISEKYKLRLQARAGQRKEDRPPQFGYSLGQAYAFSDQFFAKLNLEHVQESRNASLQNERGYFSASSARAEFTIEPIYDFLLSASYALGVEFEEDPRVNSKTRIGSDQYGLGARYSTGAFVFDLSGNYTVTNSPTRSLSIKGGLQWTI